MSEQSQPSREDLREALRSGEVPENSASVYGFPPLTTPGDVWLSTAQAAKITGLEPASITTMTSRTRNRVHVRENAWPAGVHVGRENYFPASEVLAWCDREHGAPMPNDLKESI
jgi:hypothetical protein